MPEPTSITVVLPDPDDHDVVDGDDGRSAAIPTWSLSSGIALADHVQAWPDGVDFDGDLTEGPTAIAQLERDALNVLAAIAAHRRAAGRGAQSRG